MSFFDRKEIYILINHLWSLSTRSLINFTNIQISIVQMHCGSLNNLTSGCIPNFTCPVHRTCGHQLAIPTELGTTDLCFVAYQCMHTSEINVSIDVKHIIIAVGKILRLISWNLILRLIRWNLILRYLIQTDCKDLLKFKHQIRFLCHSFWRWALINLFFNYLFLYRCYFNLIRLTVLTSFHYFSQMYQCTFSRYLKHDHGVPVIIKSTDILYIHTRHQQASLQDINDTSLPSP